MLMRLKDKFTAFLPSGSLDLNSFPDRLESWQYILLGFFIYIACYYGLSAYTILDMNEGLYAEIAREMLVNKHYIIPYLNNVPYLEKPPLLYWLVALSNYIFGINEFAARIVPSTFYALTAVSVICFGKRIAESRTGFIASIILLSSLVFSMIGRVVFFDMALTFFTSVSLFSFYHWTQQKKNTDLYLSAFFLGLAVMTKGLLALFLLPLVMLIFLYFTQAPKSDYQALFNKKAGLILLAVILPWHLMAAVALPQFFWEYFINNQVLRFFNQRVPHDYHTGPLYYYLPRFIAYLLPWTIFLPALLRFRNFKKPVSDLHKFLWTWFLVMLIFFTLSGEKGDYYLVIGIVPMAYLIAQKIEEWFKQDDDTGLTYGFYVITGLLIIAGIISLIFYSASNIKYAAQYEEDKIPRLLTGPIVILITGLIIYLIAGFYICRKNPSKPVAPFLLLAGLNIILIFFYIDIRERTQLLYSQAALAAYVSAQYQVRNVYFYQDYEALSSFVFYNHAPSIIVDNKSADLYFGAHLKSAKNQFISMTDFLAVSSRQPLYIAMKSSNLNNFQQAVGAENKNLFCVVKSSGKIILLTNAAEDCQAQIDIQQGVQKQWSLTDIKEAGDKKIQAKLKT